MNIKLKEDLVSAALIFRDYNYEFPYKIAMTTSVGCDKNKVKKYLQNNSDDKILDFVQNLAKKFKIRIFLRYFDDTYKSGNYGPELFIRQNCHLFWFHSNAGIITKLPAGVSKIDGCKHRLDKILNTTFDRKMKIRKCPLDINANFDKLEKKYGAAFNIWEKESNGPNTYNIENIRESRKNAKKINLHHDKNTGKLFLVTCNKLYFRGYLKKLKNKI